MSKQEWDCPHGICDGTGFVYETGAPGQADTAVSCQCRADRMRRRRRARAARAIPDHYATVALDRNPLALLDARSRKVLAGYIDKLGDHIDAGTGLWLAGEPGIGKTSAAALIGLRAGEANYSVAFWEVSRLFDRLKTAFRATEEDRTEGALIDQLAEIDLLILDDLVAGHGSSEWITGAFYRILNSRANDDKATVVTTDVDREELIHSLGYRTVSRLDRICGHPLELRYQPPLQAVGT